MLTEIRVTVAADGAGARNQARGKVFERFVADVLRHLGFDADFCRATNVTHAGMEIDVEAHHVATGTPLIAECKLYSDRIDAPKLQAFFGKFMGQWLRDKQVQGMFIAIPGLNSSAAGFWKESMTRGEATLTLIESDKMVELARSSGLVAAEEVYARAAASHGSPGDAWLLCTEDGYYWAQFVIPHGDTVANATLLLDAAGRPLSAQSADRIALLNPELEGFDLLNSIELPEPGAEPAPPGPVVEMAHQVAEVRGSASCFEYQLPASPQFFFGRESRVAETVSFVSAVRDGSTSIRGLLLQGASGWGKSSLALRVAAAMRESGDLAVVIDSRTASSPRFVIDVVQYVARKLGEEEPESFAALAQQVITGYEGAADVLRQIGAILSARGRVLLLLLDQFENLFFEVDALLPVRDMFLSLADDLVPVVFGFAWKSDLLGVTDSFPYQARDAIAEKTERVSLPPFSQADVEAMLRALESEIGGKLRADLEFLIKEYSQGLPWLLKKLCAHVKAQIEGGASQRDVADSVLNVGDLFAADLEELTPQAQSALQRLAKLVPVDVADLSDDFRPEVLQSLVDRRLIVRVGSKYDIYWDIFRDYLNLGVVPVQENYMLRAQVGSVSKVLRIVRQSGGSVRRTDLVRPGVLSEGSYYNVTRDMRLLGLISIRDDAVSLAQAFPEEAEAFEEATRAHLHEKLSCNRSVRLLTEALQARREMTLESVACLLRDAHPYVNATDHTWQMYGRVLMTWMDIADLGVLNKSSWTIGAPQSGIARVFRRNILRAGRGGDSAVPEIQYSAIEQVALRIAAAVKTKNPVDWSGLSASSIGKSLAALDHLGFVSRRQNSLAVHEVLFEFAQDSERRRTLFREAALRRPAFAVFIEVLKEYETSGASMVVLGQRVAEKVGGSWTNSTARWAAKIMLDWARAAGLAPGVFSEPRRGGYGSADDSLTLFDLLEDEPGATEGTESQEDELPG